MFLCPDYHLNHDIAKHGYSGVVRESTEGWNGVRLSSVMRHESRCCLYTSDDVRVYGIDLVSVIFRSVYAHDTQAPPQASWCERSSVTTRGHIWRFCKVKKTVIGTLHRLLSPCYCQFFARKVICFFTRTHSAVTTQRALRGVQQLSWPARSLDFSPIERVWDMMKRELNFSPDPATTIAELRQWVQDIWDNLL